MASSKAVPEKTEEITPEEGSTYYCYSHPKTQQFMADLKAVFERHKMVLVPTFQHEPSLHDSLQVVPLTEEYLDFTINSGFDPKDFGFKTVFVSAD